MIAATLFAATMSNSQSTTRCQPCQGLGTFRQGKWLLENRFSGLHNRRKYRKNVCFGPKCTTASQPQSLAIFGIAGEIARNFSSEKQIWPFFIAKCIATATESLPQRNRNLFPRKNRWVQFDRVNESQTSTANHRRETVHLVSALPPKIRQSLSPVEKALYE